MKNFFLFFNHVKTTERINMGLRPYDTKSFVDGHRLPFFFILILFLINFRPYIFPPITYKYCCYGNVCSFFLKKTITSFICILFITCEQVNAKKEINDGKHLSVEFSYLYADNVFGYENWSHEIQKSNYR